MIERVRSHQSVVRLHSGDLSLYSAIHEQMQALAEASIPFEVIPGISAFQAAAAKLGVELTVPGLVQTIILTRISGRASAVPESEELASLAAHQASLCLYLSARHVEDAQGKLQEHYPSDTPVAVCFRIGWPDEQIWLVPLEEMAAITQKENLIRTTLYVISPALRTVGKAGMQSVLLKEQTRSLTPEENAQISMEKSAIASLSPRTLPPVSPVWLSLVS
jgi:precorrin-4/cobalt-precorrin-4 C11-methyltransferase